MAEGHEKPTIWLFERRTPGAIEESRALLPSPPGGKVAVKWPVSASFCPQYIHLIRNSEIAGKMVRIAVRTISLMTKGMTPR